MGASLLPLILLAAVEEPPPAAYPAEAVLDAFTQVCRGVEDYAAAGRAAREKGWKDVAPDDDPNLRKLVDIGMKAVTDGRKVSLNFRRTVKGRTLYLVLSRFQDAKSWANGCRVYDFTAPTALPQPLLEKWMKRPSTFRQAQEGVLTKLSWEPGWGKDITVEAAHVPRGSELTGRTGLAGNVLVAQVTGQAAP